MEVLKKEELSFVCINNIESTGDLSNPLYAKSDFKGRSVYYFMYIYRLYMAPNGERLSTVLCVYVKKPGTPFIPFSASNERVSIHTNSFKGPLLQCMLEIHML